jgi:Zn-dependent metalloprotease
MRLYASGLFVLAALVATGCDGCGHSTSKDAGANAGVDAGPLGPLAQATGVGWTLFTDGTYGGALELVPNDPPPPTFTGTTTAVQAAQTFLQSWGSLLGIGSFSELSLVCQPVPDISGLTWVSFQQAENGVPVYQGRVLVAFDTNGSVGLVSSGYVPGLQTLSVTPAQTPAQAVAAAQADIESQQGDAGADAGVGDFVAASTPVLAIYPGASSSDLAYRVQVTYSIAEGDYWIDAQTGAVLFADDPRETFTAVPTLGTVPNPGPGSAVTDTGTGSYPDTKQFTAFRTPGFDYLQQQIPESDAVLSVQMIASLVLPLAGVDPSSSEVSLVASNQPNWSQIGAGYPPKGESVDAYVYALDAEQWFQTRYGWDSFDNAGADLVVVEDALPTSQNVDNALWDPPYNAMFVFQTLQYNMPPTVALDVVGHEYTHAVIEYTLGLPTGPMNEALADEFGQYIEYANSTPYTSSPATIGEGWLPGGIRNLQEPHSSPVTKLPGKSGPQPNNVYDPLYSTTNDVHFNDGVPNSAWYLATWGGQNSTSLITVPGDFGMSASAQLYTTFLLAGCAGHGGGNCGPKVSSFKSFAADLLATATMAFGKCSSQIQSVGCAWYATGLMAPDTLAGTFGVTSCQCPAGGTYCGSQILYSNDPNQLYTCSGGLTTIVDCSTDSPGRGCGSPEPIPDGTPINVTTTEVATGGALNGGVNQGCWPGGAAAGAGCGSGTPCACPLACLGGTCQALANAVCLGSSSSSSSSSGSSSSSSSSGGCDSCEGPTVTLSYSGSQTLGCWVALQPPASQGLYAEISNSNAFSCGYTAGVQFYMSPFNNPSAGSCPPLAVGTVYSLTDPTMNANCIQVVAGGATALPGGENGWQGQAGASWSGAANVIYGFPLPPASCTNCGSCAGCVGPDAGIFCGVGNCLNCQPTVAGSLTITSLDPFTVEFSAGAALFSEQTIHTFPPMCPSPAVVGISGTMSAPLVQYPSTGGASGIGSSSSSSGSGSSGGSSSGANPPQSFCP